MPVRRMFRMPVETAKHRQLKQLCIDYFNAYKKLMGHPSMINAARARKACIGIKKVAYARGIELLDLYASSRNKGREPIYPIKHRQSTLDKKNEKKVIQYDYDYKNIEKK